MSHPLIDRLVTELAYQVVSLANHDEFVDQPGMNVLFFPGDPETVRDATDVAVVLPELVDAFDGKLRPGVVTDVFEDGLALETPVWLQGVPGAGLRSWRGVRRHPHPHP